jgi:hypothetical protein
LEFVGTKFIFLFTLCVFFLGWQFAKAMSSAVARQLPTVTSILVKPEVVCPLLPAREGESARTHALSLYVMGLEEEGEGEGVKLINAAKDVASSLADVLKALEAPTELKWDKLQV